MIDQNQNYIFKTMTIMNTHNIQSIKLEFYLFLLFIAIFAFRNLNFVFYNFFIQSNSNFQSGKIININNTNNFRNNCVGWKYKFHFFKCTNLA